MALTPTTVRRRCAIYTRKSHEEGLDQDFNSLDAQRDSGEAFVASQRHEGWDLLAEKYDDGGFTGANTERPALARLMKDIEAGRIDVVLVYKVDRLSRSLLDFVNLLQVFERHNVAFVSVTQQFNTATPMGRLVLNILICFAQFERENIAERIRDKMAASRRRGKWVGGAPPFGYDVDYTAKRLVINEAEADIVRWIFTRMAQVKSVSFIINELRERGITSKAWRSKTGKIHPGIPFDRGNLYKLFHNRTYLGVCCYQGTDYPGEHQAILTREQWDAAHAVLKENHHARTNRSRATVPGFLKGLCHCAACGSAMTMTWTRGKNGGRYRYYRCSSLQKGGAGSCPVSAIPAGTLEAAVLDQIRTVLRSPGLIKAASMAAKSAMAEGGQSLDHATILSALCDLDHVWDELFPAEQSRVAEHLIEDVVVGIDRTDLRLRSDAVAYLATEASGMSVPSDEQAEQAINLPLQAMRRSGRTTMVAISSAVAPVKTDPPMVVMGDSIDLALARAFRWLDDLTQGKAASISAIADKERVDEAYVRRHLRLTLLAPSLIERLLARDLPGISLSKLTRQELPDDWQAQAVRIEAMA